MIRGLRRPFHARYFQAPPPLEFIFCQALEKDMRGMRSYAIRDRLLNFAARHRGRQLELVSYDISGHDNRTAVAVSHFLFGHSTRKGEDRGGKEYRYPGFVERDGVVWVGQSVFLATPERSEELRAFLASRGVAHGRVRVRTD